MNDNWIGDLTDEQRSTLVCGEIEKRMVAITDAVIDHVSKTFTSASIQEIEKFAAGMPTAIKNTAVKPTVREILIQAFADVRKRARQA